MTPEQLRAEWIAELESGKYRQGIGRLKKIVDGVPEYCCLGIAGEVLVRHGLARWGPPASDGTCWLYEIDAVVPRSSSSEDSSANYLPPNLVGHMGIHESKVVEDATQISNGSLGRANDDFGFTFQDIADVLKGTKLLRDG